MQYYLDFFQNFCLESSKTFLEYQKFYLEELLKLNKSLNKAKEEFFFAMAINQHQAFTNTILLFIENEVNPKIDKLQGLKNLFFTKLYLDSISPKNFPFFDKNFIKMTEEQNYQNLIKGFMSFLEDMQDGKFNFTNKKDFVVGESIAYTEGKIVFKNDIFELISYKPQDKINSIPILLVPACINKYYIFDLQEKNSFVKWLSDNNYQVFVVSWVNPNENTQNFTFSDYIFATELAISKITEDFGFKNLHLVGYCLGGIFTTLTASILQSKDLLNRIKSLTFLTTQLDFSEPNDFSIFLEEQSWEIIKFTVLCKNMMDGFTMGNFFNFIKAKEMIFQYILDNYFYAKEKSKIDFLAWNADSTNITSKFYIEYIESTYIKDLIAKNQMKIHDFSIDISKIDLPSYFLATENDHIVPHEDAFRSAQLLKNSKKRFVLGGSGHVAGVINPPINKKYKYTVNDKEIDCEFAEWKKDAKEFPGSWWADWLTWLNNQNKNTIKNDYDDLPKISKAPGEFVKEKLKLY